MSIASPSCGGGFLAIHNAGPRDAPAVISHHGTPSCRLDVPGGTLAPAATGVRVVSFDRPGYGGSTPMAGRCVADAARDAMTVADALGLEQFAVIGTSGGGPHALATAALAPERVTAALSLSGSDLPTTPASMRAPGCCPRRSRRLMPPSRVRRRRAHLSKRTAPRRASSTRGW